MFLTWITKDLLLSKNLFLKNLFQSYKYCQMLEEIKGKKKLKRYAAAAAKSLQSCWTLCDPIVGSPPGSPVPGILQARTLELVAISFSSAWKWKVKVKSLSRVWLFATPWTAAHQAPPSMGFSRQEYWSGVPLPSLILGTQVLRIESPRPQSIPPGAAAPTGNLSPCRVSFCFK